MAPLRVRRICCINQDSGVRSYRDDMFLALYYPKHECTIKLIQKQLGEVYGRHLQYTVDMHRVDEPSIPTSTSHAPSTNDSAPCTP